MFSEQVSDVTLIQYNGEYHDGMIEAEWIKATYSLIILVVATIFGSFF